MKNRVVAERIKRVFEHQDKRTRLFDSWCKEVNCCGALAHGLDIGIEMRAVSPTKFLEDFKLTNPPDLFPGYVPTAAGLEYLRRRCEETKIPQEGDIVIFWKNRDWSHSGIYLGEFDDKRIMYNKDGIDKRFSLTDIDKYFREYSLDDFSFHRIK